MLLAGQFVIVTFPVRAVIARAALSQKSLLLKRGGKAALRSDE
jgi:hypothetical protein